MKVIGQKMGIETCFGTDPEYKDSVFTGKVEGTLTFPRRKLKELRFG